MKMVCLLCEKTFTEKPSRVKEGRGKYCSKSCYSLHRRNHFSDIQTMINRYVSGETLRQIAIDYNCSPTSIKNILIENNIDRRNCHDRLYPSGSKSPLWRGGLYICKNGYRQYKEKGTRAYEHRMVAESKIGRKLQKGEHVHHINGDKLDNRPENLMVLSASEHVKLHAKMRYSHGN